MAHTHTFMHSTNESKRECTKNELNKSILFSWRTRKKERMSTLWNFILEVFFLYVFFDVCFLVFFPKSSEKVLNLFRRDLNANDGRANKIIKSRCKNADIHMVVPVDMKASKGNINFQQKKMGTQ
jgi:hypothetical protein